MRKLFLVICLLLAASPTFAAVRDWNPYSVTGAVSGTAGVCRLTISPAIVGGGLVNGDTVITAGLTGVTGCDVTTTVTVIDTTHIELAGTTFGGAAPVGGCVSGGHWTATNTANWAASSTATCGSGGSSVPGAADAVTFDANSGPAGTTIIADASISGVSIGTFTIGACTCTLDFSVGNPNITITGSGGWSLTGNGTRVYKLGSGTFTLTNATALLTTTTITGLTLTAGTSTLEFTTLINASVSLGGLPWFNVKVDTATGFVSFTGNGSTIGGTLTAVAPVDLLFPTTGTYTIANLNITGASSANNVGFVSAAPLTGSTVVVTAGYDFQWAGIASINFTGSGTMTAHNSLDLQRNTAITITPPSGGSHCIGC